MSRRRQHGQALVETALVIPILVLMVFGTFYVTYAYMQRSIMNGVAFMAARAVSVRAPGESAGLAKQVAERMVTNAKLGKGHWLGRAVITGSAADGVHIEEPDGMWSFLARIVSSTAGASAKHAHVNIRLYPEWERISDSGGRTATYHMISYTVNEVDVYEKALTFFGALMHSKQDERIGEPDSFSTGNGGVDKLGGTDYQENTAKLEKQKGYIGLEPSAPADNENDVLPPRSSDSDLTKLELIGDTFVAIQGGTKLLSLALPELKAMAAPFQPLFDKLLGEADVAIDKSVSLIQIQETQTLSPGKGL